MPSDSTDRPGSQRRGLIVLLGIAFLGVSLLLLGDRSEVSSPIEKQEESRADSDLVQRTSPSRVEEIDRVRQSLPKAASEEREAPVEIEVVEIVLRASPDLAGRDVAGLQVKRLDRAALPPWTRFQLEDATEGLDPIRLRDLCNKTQPGESLAIADADGVARFAPLEGRGCYLVSAECAGQRVWGHAFHLDRRSTIELVVRPIARGLTVRVLDDRGRPAGGVPLQLAADRSLPSRFGDAVTGPDGLARVVRWPALLRRNPRRESLFLSVVLPLAEVLRVEVARGHDLDEVIEFRLPPTCSVDVRCVGFGRVERGSAGLYPWPQPPSASSNLMRAAPLQALQFGMTSFERVGLGHEFVAFVKVPERNALVERIVRTPENVRERLEVVFDGLDLPSLRGRLADPSGELLGPRSIDLEIEAPLFSSVESIQLDSTGGFQLYFSPEGRRATPTEIAFRGFGTPLRVPLVVDWQGVRDIGTLRFD